MNIDPTLQAMLDAPTKAFEVALRSFVSDVLLSKYTNEQALKTEIQNRMDAIKGTGIILSGKITSIKVLSSKDWSSFWTNMQFSRNCYLQKAHTSNHDVAFLSQTILMTYLFQDLHSSLIASFDSPENYLFQANNYYEVRNALSHQGSTVVTDSMAVDSLYFMRIGCSSIDQKYFWFKSSSLLEKDFKAFEDTLYSKKPRIENLDDIPFPSNTIVCREPELSMLFKYICGWDGSKKLRNRKHSVCVTGYGGIGKTSLVTEFISRLILSMQTDEYKGLRPMFVLFYSAKSQSMDFDKCSGSLYLKECRKQFSGCDELLSKVFNALSISEFDDDWHNSGILIVDNLETLSEEERKKIINYIEADLPSSIQVIITTRIPENADETITLHGFQNESGLNFIREYLTKNGVDIDLTEDQQKDLIRYSYGNSLVLVLALRRMASKKASYREIIGELQRLPKNTAESSISHFMFQNTIEELFNLYPQYAETLKKVLVCLSVRQEPLSVEILAQVNKDNTIEEIQDVLRLLAKYLVVEKVGDYYSINEFANHFIVTSLPLSPSSKAKLESDLLTAIREIEQEKHSIEEFKSNYPELSKVLSEWCGKSENESLAICHAFSLYTRKKLITSGNAAFEIENLTRDFSKIEHTYNAHPYVYYQQARILKELRQETIVGNEYNDQIKSKYDSCLMLINSPPFAEIKETETYPSILWIYAMFLLSIGSFEPASHYANDSVSNFERLRIKEYKYYDALLVWGLSEINLFESNSELPHLRNALCAKKKVKITEYTAKIVKDHHEELSKKLEKYSRFSV